MPLPSPETRQDACGTLQRQFLGNLRDPRVGSIVVVAAHPDDEVIGAGAHLGFWPNLTVVHVTDGAPRDDHYAREAGFPDRQAYAAARRREASAALALAGVSAERMIGLAFTDQEASLHLRDIAGRLAALVGTVRPAVIVTHAYEGGHPDHDATCFAVHAACGIIERSGSVPPALVEMSAYFGKEGERVTGAFLPPAEESVTIQLDEADRARKERMLLCHASQHDLLRAFPPDRECFRPAPRYDFRQAPHAGRLFYEYDDTGITGGRWRELAGAALQTLARASRS
jgi:N-acetylglucosamine malate deacetylase 2